MHASEALRGSTGLALKVDISGDGLKVCLVSGETLVSKKVGHLAC